ncbi:MAG TPA: hypothetical protein VFZ73_03360 [Gemmatimonadaceae bacterium]
MLRTILALSCALPLTVLAQGNGASSTARARAALAPFQRLVGTWEGDARVTLVPGAPAQVVRQREEIALGANGTTMTVRTVATATEGPQKGAVIFQASATVWYDTQLNKLRMKARQAAGDSVEADIETRPDTLIWALPVQGGRIRFTIAHSATDWHEVAHFIRDGAPPIQAMEMRLKKTK